MGIINIYAFIKDFRVRLHCTNLKDFVEIDKRSVLSEVLS